MKNGMILNIKKMLWRNFCMIFCFLGLGLGLLFTMVYLTFPDDTEQIERVANFCLWFFLIGGSISFFAGLLDYKDYLEPNKNKKEEKSNK
jgi:Na+-driven multidrug efflux pump